MAIPVLAFLVFVTLSSVCSKVEDDNSAMNIYNFQVEDLDGKLVSLNEYRGKMLLIVNVASECGYTESQYKGLVQLQSELGYDQFQILAFPCNDFGQQEPLPAKDVLSLMEKTYGINFPIFQKVNIVIGETSPIFKYLQDKTGEKVKWNFYKFLISADGEPLSAWGPSTSVESLITEIRDRILLQSLRSGQHRGSRSEF